MSAVKFGQENEVLLLHEKIFVVNSVHHKDPDTGQCHHHTSKDDPKDIEDHEWGQGDKVDRLDGVEAKQTNADEDQATVDLLTCERVARVKTECEQGDEEQN